MDKSQDEPQGGRKPMDFSVLSSKIYDPSIIGRTPATMTTASATGRASSTNIPLDLSVYPWRLAIDHDNSDDDAIDGSLNDQADNDDKSRHFPPFSYLDIRLKQNNAFAESRLREGNEEMFMDSEKAKSIYREGLELVPNHVGLLLALGKLYARQHDRTNRELGKRHFVEALRIEPSNNVAKLELEKINHSLHTRVQTMKKKATAEIAHNSSAYQDALLERSMLFQDDNNNNDDDPQSNDRIRKKSKRKKKEKKRHKKKRSRKHYTTSSSEDSSDDDDAAASKKDVSQEKRRKRKHDPVSDSSSSSEDSADRKRRKRKRKKKRSNKEKKRSKSDHKEDDKGEGT